jgi:small subunit ribosomal protein S1
MSDTPGGSNGGNPPDGGKAPGGPARKDSPGGFGGFGDRKPKATFGDVMKGIPAGRPGEKPRGNDRGGDRGNDRGGGGPRGNDRGPKREDRGGGMHVRRNAKPAEGKQDGAGGPEVVVVRKPGEGEEPRRAAIAPPSLVYSRSVEEQGGEDDGASFADLLAKSDLKSTRGGVRPGARVTGVIIQLGEEIAFLTLKEGGEAMIERRELTVDDAPEPKVGDRVEGFVISVGGKAGGVLISKGLAKGAANLGRLEDAKNGGMPVEGTVTGVNKGGLEVDLGGVRGFCPISQADVKFVEKPEAFIGQKLQFRVSEIKEGDVVLSRRALLEAERAEQAEKIRGQLTVGAKLRGKVSSVRDFGAFVDLGGIEGMIHISEMSHGRVAHPRDVLTQGQEVEVEITKIDPGDPGSPDKSKQRERIGLSLRALEADPWTEAEATFPVGARVPGKVVRIQPFGAFVELAPGIDGLIHVSNLSDQRIAHPKDVVSEGQEVEVVVEKVDSAQRKIGLALWREGYTGPKERTVEELADESAQPGERPERAMRSVNRAKVGDVVQGTVDRVESYGVFVSFPTGRGLIPNAEMGTARGTDHKKQFPAGTVIKCAVVEIDNQGRLRLSVVAAEVAEERAEVAQWQQKNQPKQKGSGFGTLGDLLKAKLQK